MSYANTGRPRFYIDWNVYSVAMGLVKGGWTYRGSVANLNGLRHPISLNPGKLWTYTQSHVDYMAPIINWDGIPFDVNEANWLGVLGHEMAGKGIRLSSGKLPIDVAYENHSGNASYNSMHHVQTNWAPVNGILNSSATAVVPEYNGFTLCELNGSTNSDWSDDKLWKQHLIFYLGEGVSRKVGTWCWGNTYDMPISPDLKVKMSTEMDGVTQYKTKGGSTLSNAMFTGPPNWGDLGPWELHDPNADRIMKPLRVGRRTWDLSFSFLSDSDIMPVLGVPNYIDGTTDYLVGASDIASSNDFFSQVWNRTMGGHLPFIFQPDNTDFSPSGFAIARFDMKSLKITQSMHRKYKVKLKIRESW